MLISVRACIRYAISAIADKKGIVNQKIDDFTLVDDKSTDWLDNSDYAIGHFFYEKYLDLVKEDVGNFKCFVFEQLGEFLIGFHPNLLTKEEKTLIELLDLGDLPHLPSAMQLPGAASHQT